MTELFGDGPGLRTGGAGMADEPPFPASLLAGGVTSASWRELSETVDPLVGDGVLMVDDADSVVFANRRFREMFGLPVGVAVNGLSRSRLLGRLAERGVTASLPDGTAISDWPAPEAAVGQVLCLARLPDGRLFQVSGWRLSNGGVCYGCTDLFDRRVARELLRRANKAAAVNLATLSEFWDGGLGDHLYRVARMAAEITTALYRARQFPLVIDERFREEIAASSILHDVGKFAVPESVVRKPGLLTPAEREQMQRHTVGGAHLLERSARLWDNAGYLARGAEIARYHHERFDGSGYPEGLAGEAIPLAARIVAVADVYDALISERSYKAAWEPARAATLILEGRGSLFDPLVVDAFQRVLHLRAAMTVVVWSESMAVGVPTLDRDHKALVGLLNQLAAAEDRQDRINLEEVLDELVSYTLYHFEKEERLMAEAGYPDLAAHALRHRRLSDRVLAIRRRFFDADQPALGDEVVDFLTSWLRSHILGDDLQYVPYLQTLPGVAAVVTS
ncbi:MAG: bacteriohemerythrin [Rhodospirillaceae bacterium]